MAATSPTLSEPGHPSAVGPLRSRCWLAAGLGLLVLVAFQGAVSNDFVSYDDPRYVTEQPLTQRGLSWEGMRWALTDTSFNWHPLTRLSHMLDCQLFGLDPAMHHLTSVVLHATTVVLLFLTLARITARPWPSALAAALFGIHPLRVESVVWIAERKDVLATLCWVLAMGLHGRAARTGTRLDRLGVACAMALGVMAKQTLVTLPFALLLLDYWPLGRLAVPISPRRLQALVAEKLPLFALSAAGIAAALVGQAGYTMPLERLPLSDRAANALVATTAYLSDLVSPRGLAVFYPLPDRPPWGAAVASGAVIALLTWAAIRCSHNRGYLVVGWLWFLGTLVPVLGLVQIGLQARADRYTYIPSIGLCVALVWWLADLVNGSRRARATAAVMAVAVLAALVLTTRQQVRSWRDSESLFRNATTVAPSFVSHLNLAEALRQGSRRQEAISHYQAACALDPDDPRPLLGLGSAYWKWGQPGNALFPLERALALAPEDPRIHFTLALALYDLGRADEALASVLRCVQLDPNLARGRYFAAVLLEGRGDTDDALAHYREAYRLDPDQGGLRNRLGLALLEAGHPEEGVQHLLDSSRRGLAPPPVLFRLADTLDELGRSREAEELRRAATVPSRGRAVVP